jgi:SAM-dependent methyltransferase
VEGLDVRERDEIERSAAEAKETVLRPAEVERYLNPPADTAYPLEYAYYLLGDVRGKTVLDFGCGTGENIIPLKRRGANVIGIDISPDLIELAKRRALDAHVEADLRVASAYNTGLPDQSIDVIFSIALIHHLEIPRVQQEIARILRKDGYVVLQEPIRFSAAYNRLRNLLPARGDISEYEHPLTADEFKQLTEFFISSDTRWFRLPFVALYIRIFSKAPRLLWRASNWIINRVPPARRYATVAVTRLRPQ